MSENVPQAKKGLSGCLVAVIVVSLCASAAIAVALFLAARSPRGQLIMSSLNQAKTMLERATTAPGVAELKQSLCTDSALVLDVDEMRKLTGPFATKEKPLLDSFPNARFQIICNPGSDVIPTCAQVAEAWLEVVKDPGGNFGVNVSKKGQSNGNCSRLYSATGEEITKKRPTR
jgi:hypothetical protein